MSIHVLKRKQDAKTKLTKQNQYASARNQPFSLNMTNRGSVRSVPVMGEINKPRLGGCCPPNGAVRKAVQSQSYFNYNRRSTGGLGGLAARVVTLKNPSDPLSPDLMLTYKRSPDFSQMMHIKDKKIKEIRCDHKAYLCDPNATPPFSSKNPNITKPTGTSFLGSYVEPECRNNCGKGKAQITKNLGFMSSSDYLNKKMSYRKMSGNYEEPLMNNASCTVIE